MVAHVTVPALDSDPNHVATTSSTIVNGLLKTQLGFRGLVITDALDMAGLTSLYRNDIGRAAVDAFKAGNDVLLIPADLEASVEAMTKAARSGEISQSRLDESVLKILQTKASLGLHKARLVDLNRLPVVIGTPENAAIAQQIADDAITLIRDSGTLLPLKKTGTMPTGLPYQHTDEAGNNLVLTIFSEDMRTASGRTLERQIRKRARDVKVIYIDSRTASALSNEVLEAVDQAQAVVAAVYLTPTAGKIMKADNGGIKNSVALENSSGVLLQNILDHAAAKTIMVASGNPYLAQDFPAVQNYMCTFSDESISDISVAKALFGEIEIRGRLPVTIPNIAIRGAGIDKPVPSSNSGVHDAHPK